MSNKHALTTQYSRLEQIAAQYQNVLSTPGTFTQTLQVGAAIEDLRGQLTNEVMAPIMSLQNTNLGFRTDNQAGYPLPIVRDAVIEATLRGIPLVGNCFNIIAGRFYVTKEGFMYLFAHRLPDVTHLAYDIGVPVLKGDNGALVDCWATWKHGGAAERYEGTIPVRVNAGMGIDAIIGKATRKLLSRVYQRITGSNISDGEAEDMITVPGTSIPVEKEAPATTAATHQGNPFPQPKPKAGQEVPKADGQEVSKADETEVPEMSGAAEQPDASLTPAPEKREPSPRSKKKVEEEYAELSAKFMHKASVAGLSENELLTVIESELGIAASALEDYDAADLKDILAKWRTVTGAVVVLRQKSK